MKLLKLSFLMVLVSFFVACGDDEGNDCDQSTWVGVYEGTQVCNGDSETVTVTITASGSDAILIIYETDSSSVEFDPLTSTDCNLNETATSDGITLTLTATLDGDNLSLTDIVTDGTDTSTCVITATRN